jgi:hypothetical protein
MIASQDCFDVVLASFLILEIEKSPTRDSVSTAIWRARQQKSLRL